MPFEFKLVPGYVINSTFLVLAIILLFWGDATGLPFMIELKTLMWLNSVLDLLAIMLAVLIFTAGFRALESSRQGAMVMLGLLFLGVGVLDFLHIVIHADLTDALGFNNLHSADLLWLMARTLAAAAVLVYAAMPDCQAVRWQKRPIGRVAVLLAVCLMWWVDRFMQTYASDLCEAGFCLSAISVGFMWLVMGIHLTNFAVLWRNRMDLGRQRFVDMFWILGLVTVSDLLVMKLGIADKEDIFVIGQVYAVIAYVYLFRNILKESLHLPLARMEKQHLREKLALSIAPNGIVWINTHGTILKANLTMQVLTGYGERRLVGKNITQILPTYPRVKHVAQKPVHAKKKDSVTMLDVALLCHDGNSVPVNIAVGYCDDDDEYHAILYINDLTERKKFEATLHDQAFRDELTGLPNRRAFYQLLHQTLAQSQDSTATQVAVLLLDLDGFKTINDSFGHATGDVLLVQAGERAREVLRKSDVLARLGGDEFVILLNDFDDISGATQVASKLLLALSADFQLQGLTMNVSASLGLAFYPDDGQDVDTLMRHADMAMYAAKASCRGTYCLYSPAMESCMREDLQILNRLKEAMGTGALELHYQPQVDVESGDIVGVEALLRWDDPVLGRVLPARFIPIAESSGLILPLSDWVLEKACTQIADWTRANTPVRVAVNFSAQQFRLTDLSKRVADTLGRTGAQAQWLDIEITESLAMTNPANTGVQLNALVALGCRVALDDFGTGYSSLAYLKTLPIHKLKIDKSFIDGVPGDASDVAISQAIIGLARSLGMQLTAEGVETEAQLGFLRQYGCHTYQGWLFAKAMTAAELSLLLSAELAQGAHLPSH